MGPPRQVRPGRRDSCAGSSLGAAGDDERVDDDAAFAFRADHDRVYVDLSDGVALRPREVADRFETTQEGGHVGGRRPPEAGEQRGGTCFAIIASASPTRSGSARNATSPRASIMTPPAPNARTRPKSGSRVTPAKTSTPPRAISWTRN